MWTHGRWVAEAAEVPYQRHAVLVRHVHELVAAAGLGVFPAAARSGPKSAWALKATRKQERVVWRALSPSKFIRPKVGNGAL